MNQNEYNFFENSPFPQINRSGNAQKDLPKRPYTGVGRDQKIHPDLYYNLKEENEQLKKTKLNINQKILKLESNLANVKEDILKERKQGEYKVNMGKNSEFDFNKIFYENQKLKSENKKKDLIIKGLQSNYPKNKFSKKKQKKTNILEEQSKKTDYMALVARLREQLKYANEDRRNLINEIKNLKDSYQNKSVINYNYNNNYMNNFNKEMTNKIADLNTNYQSATLKLDTQNKILEITKKNLEDYINKYEKERENNKKLQTELSLLRGEMEKNANYKKLIDDYKKNEIRLEEELTKLQAIPFMKQVEERGNVYKSYQISEKNLAEAKKQLEEKDNLLTENEYRLKELERENKELKDSLGLAKLEKEKYKEESLKNKITRIEREKNDKLFQDKLNQFGQYGEIDSDFTKILSLYKNQNDQNDWENINFIEQTMGQNKDPAVLLNENKRLRLDKNTLGRELQSTKDLLLIQQQINEDYKFLKEKEIEKYKSENKLLKQKIEELCKLIDLKTMPPQYISSIKESNSYNKPISLEPKKTTLLDDNNTEYSQEETEIELGVNENALDIYFGECDYEEQLSKELGYDLADMMSFFSVDFYMHETQTSDIINGKNPMFNFQLIFKVEINENFLNYLENEKIIVECYSLRDNDQKIIGRGEIELKKLLDLENSNDYTIKQISSEVPIFYINNQNLKIATLYYKMRMRKPLTEALKWYHEENKLSQVKEPAQEAIKTQLEQTLKEYTTLGGKAYDVKILINRAIDLIVSGPARKISPYFYYKFYKKGERYSQISSGNNPQFDDVASFIELINQDLLDYIQNESLNIYIFDSKNDIELDMTSPYEARLSQTNKQIKEDLIGICSVPLQSLLINNLIQGEFPIFNMDNERVGKLAINIIWEEVQTSINTGLLNSLQLRTDINQDNLLIKLANCLKEKALNIESAFNIFDIDKKSEISIDNFKNTLIFTLKFTTNQNEMEHLIRLFFTNQGRSKLDKIDFYKIFSNLLPSSNEQKYYTYNNLHNNLDIDPNINQTNNINNTTNVNNTNLNNTNINKLNNTTHSINNQTNKNIQLTYNKDYYTANQLKEMENQEPKKDRNLKEIGELVVKYKINKGKSKTEAVDIFKYIFDKDASLGIDKKELGIGFAKMGIELNENEKNILWKKMGGNTGNIDFASFKAFHDSYCLIPISSNPNSMVSNQNKTLSSGGFEVSSQQSK